jgi:hypothetical protein
MDTVPLDEIFRAVAREGLTQRQFMVYAWHAHVKWLGQGYDKAYYCGSRATEYRALKALREKGLL